MGKRRLILYTNNLQAPGEPIDDLLTLPRPVLHQAVARRLRQRIVEGQLAPGDKLNERELSQSLQVSRTPLREAIKMLAAEGLVDLLPNRGAVVAVMSAQDVADTFELIAALEGQAGELAALRITPAALAELQALHYEMLAAFTRRDLPTYYRLNALIHSQINAAAGNRVLTQTWANINARLQALRFRSNFDEAKWQSAMAEHGQMIELLAARDADGLRRLMTTHLLHKRDAVLELMREGRLDGRIDGRLDAQLAGQSDDRPDPGRPVPPVRPKTPAKKVNA